LRSTKLCLTMIFSFSVTRSKNGCLHRFTRMYSFSLKRCNKWNISPFNVRENFPFVFIACIYYRKHRLCLGFQALPRAFIGPSVFAERRARHRRTHDTKSFVDGRAVGRLGPSAKSPLCREPALGTECAVREGASVVTFGLPSTVPTAPP
jgi:hypothetical protein